MEWFALLLCAAILLPRFAAEERIPQWKPLESLRELEDHDLVLCLATVPWSGESRSFMREVVELVKRGRTENAAGLDLELRFVNLHKKSFGFEKRSAVVYRHGKPFDYWGKLSAERVLEAVNHASTHDLFDQLGSPEELEKFVDSTDRAFILVDRCGWTSRSTVERCETGEETTEFGLLDRLLYESANRTLSVSSWCDSPVAELEFGLFYRNFTDSASRRFLNPRRWRFGILTIPRVLEDAGLEIPKGKPWALLRRAQDISRSWQVLHDPASVDEFLDYAGVVVDELDRDTEIPREIPSVLLFLSFSPDFRNESIEALRIVRQVARHYGSVHQWKPARNASNSNFAPVVIEDDRVRKIFGSGRSIVLRREDLGARLEGILQLLLEGRSSEDDQEDIAAAENRTSQESPDESMHNVETAKDSKGAEQEQDGTLGIQKQALRTDQDDTPAEGNQNDEISHHEQETSEELQEREEEQGGGDKNADDDSKFNFGFFDDASLLQELLTDSSSDRPSLVAVFPERNARYVYPRGVPLSFPALVEFLDGARGGIIPETMKSGPAAAAPRESVTVPFVNRDFHKLNPVPSVTLDTFSELVTGFRKGSNSSTRATNALVMFTLPWCGFCKRMELAVHEVYKYLQERKPADFKVPSVYQMDCSSNDCTSILANVLKEEEFPSLLLFAPKDKHKVSVYKDAPTVNGILHFLRTHKSATANPSSTIKIQQTRLDQQANQESDQTQRIEVGHILVATEKLSSESPNFSNSTVLIVSVSDEHTIGLVTNKDMRKEDLFPDDQLLGVEIGYGGPLYPQAKHIFALTGIENIDGFGAIAYGLYAGGPSATEKALEIIQSKNARASEFRFVAGHCGWSRRQLQEEISAGYWQQTLYREDMFQWGDGGTK